MTHDTREELVNEFDQWYRSQKEMNPYIMRDWFIGKLYQELQKAREERDTYWKERVRKEVEGMKGIYDENGLQTQWIQKAELLQALDNMK